MTRIEISDYFLAWSHILLLKNVIIHPVNLLRWDYLLFCFIIPFSSLILSPTLSLIKAIHYHRDLLIKAIKYLRSSQT